MKLASMIMAPAFALAVAATPAFADETPTMTVTINGKIYARVNVKDVATIIAEYEQMGGKE